MPMGCGLNLSHRKTRYVDNFPMHVWRNATHAKEHYVNNPWITAEETESFRRAPTRWGTNA
jgi:hypothetical protein